MDAAIYLNNDTPLFNNLLNIKQVDRLNMSVTFLSLIRINELNFSSLPKIFNFNYLKELHKHIYGDVFEWAGETSKEKEEKVNIILNQVNNIDWLRLYLEEKAEKLTDLLFDLTRIKPFEIGSYQTAMIFIEKIAKAECIALDHSYLDSKAVIIENYITAENTLCRERVINIVKEAITHEMVRENSAKRVSEYIKKEGYIPTYNLVDLIKKINMRLFKFHTVAELYDLYKYPERLGDMDKKLVCDIADGFAHQETRHVSPTYKYKEPEYTP